MKKTVSNDGKDEKKWELSYIVGKNVKYWDTLENGTVFS